MYKSISIKYFLFFALPIQLYSVSQPHHTLHVCFSPKTPYKILKKWYTCIDLNPLSFVHSHQLSLYHSVSFMSTFFSVFFFLYFFLLFFNTSIKYLHTYINIFLHIYKLQKISINYKEILNLYIVVYFIHLWLLPF